MRKNLQIIIALVIAYLLGDSLVNIASAQESFTPPTTVTRVYRVDKTAVDSLAAELRRAFQDDPTIRIAVEKTSGRIVVVAPEAVQRELQPLMQATGPVTAAEIPMDSSLQRTADDRPPPDQRMIQLRAVSAKQLQANIGKFYGGRAPLQRSVDGKTEIMNIDGALGSMLQLRFEHATNRIRISGVEAAVEAWDRLIRVLDKPRIARDEATQLVAVPDHKQASFKRAMQLIQLRTNDTRRRPTTRADIIQWNKDKTPATPKTVTQLAQAPDPPSFPDAANPLPAEPPQTGGEDQQEGLLGPVQIEYLEGLDVIVLRGNKKDVDRVNAIIKEIEQLSVVTEPAIEVVDLEHVDSEAMAELVRPLHDEVLSVRQGRVSITPLVKPNSLLLVGREESVRVLTELIKRLDRPVAPNKQFHVFRLSYLNAADAEQTITNFYEERGGLGTKVRVVADIRSNSLVIQASPRDAAEIRQLLSEVDVAKGAAVSEVRVFRLKNSLAQELAPVLEQALRGSGGTQQNQFGGGLGGAAGAAPGLNTGSGTSNPISTTLSLTTIDPLGKRQYQSGVLADVQVAADTRANAIIVRGPAESMELIAALIRQLDELPDEDAEIKVFSIVHGDATLLAQVLEQLFGSQTAGGGVGGGGFGGGGFQQGSVLNSTIAENPLIALRFSVDERTNSIVASGSLSDLRVVEAILLRLDEEGNVERESVVYRLRYASSNDVALAVNDFLNGRRQILELAPNSVSPLQQTDQEVVVVSEPVSNSLLVSATPQYFNEIEQIVRDLDARPPMVMIQVLIAEIDLSKFYELGVEFGIQDPLLFDRSVLTDVITPGFNFNNRPLGNANNASSFLSAGSVGAQGLGSFGVGRINSELGFGGLVLSASSDALSVLIRALQTDRRLQVLSRPQVMAMDNQTAFVQIGQRVPRVTSSQISVTGTINNTVLEDVGLILGVTPRISPDGLVIMEINAENSKLGPVDEGIPIAISVDGTAILSPIIDTARAETTVSARSGQTVIIGGLISERDLTLNRGVPFLSHIPLLGDLFKYEQDARDRKELLIVLTPYIIRDGQDVNCVNQMEADRMSWCLSDVYRVHGYFDTSACPGGFVCGQSTGGPDQCETIYPDENPAGTFTSDYLDPSGDVRSPDYGRPDARFYQNEGGSSVPINSGQLPSSDPQGSIPYGNQPYGDNPNLPTSSLNVPRQTRLEPPSATAVPGSAVDYDAQAAISPAENTRLMHEYLMPHVRPPAPDGSRAPMARMQPATAPQEVFIARDSQWNMDSTSANEPANPINRLPSAN